MKHSTHHIAMLAEYTISVALAAIGFYNVARTVTEPYVDEIFHFPQTVRYCEGDFAHWDDKITTPPGLYLLGYIYSKILAAVPSEYLSEYLTPCSLNALRSLNFGGVVLGIPAILYFLLDVDPTVAAMPLLAFYSTLYYTDVWSAFFILLSLGLARRKRAFLSALAAGCSIWFRQTNIIWAGFVCVTLLDGKSFSSTVTNVFRKWRVTVSFGSVAAGFVGFLYWNQGITLGDKSNHVAAQNIPQLFYFALHFIFFSFPLWLNVSTIKKYIKMLKSPRWLLIIVLGFASICYHIENSTIVHPFILSDNRHYTFYLWRRLINPSYNPYAKFLPAPIYLLGCLQFLITAGNSIEFPITFTALIGSILVTLVPSPLFEPRYYILPYLIWRVYYRPTVTQRRLEWLWYMIINIATIWVFVNKPFEGPQGTSRFMW